MSYTTWPDDLPQSPLAGGFTGGPTPSLNVFDPEVGPPIASRMASTLLETYNATFPVMSLAQLDSFRRWFENELYAGTLSFYWRHPLDGYAYLWVFANKSQPYQINAIADGLYQVSCSLMKVTTIPADGPVPVSTQIQWGSGNNIEWGFGNSILWGT